MLYLDKTNITATNKKEGKSSERIHAISRVGL